MDKSKIMIIGLRMYLRPLLENDASEQYCSWINNKEVNKYLESKEITMEELKDYIGKKYDDPNCLFLGIYLKNNEIHIGNIKLDPIDFKKKIATLGILIGEIDSWNKGLATEALIIIIDYSFKVLKLKEINLGVHKENIGAIKAYKKSGFKIFEENETGYKMKIINTRKKMK